MAAQDQDAALRDAARARGFRLVKSRRRKPGGDLGRYGLVGLDSGRECLGFGADGLTATAEEVHAYLRGGEVASWKRSLIGVVGEGELPKPDARQADRTSPPVRHPRESGGPAPSSPEKKQKKQLDSRLPGSDVERDVEPAEPGLTIREATRRDAAALGKLAQIPAAALAKRLAAAIRAGEPPLIAMRGQQPVGLAAWTILSTLHQGPRGRITLLLVAESERRQGVGTALLNGVEEHLAEASVNAAELLLDIDFDAPAAFLRRIGWERRTNGYAKEIGG